MTCNARVSGIHEAGERSLADCFVREDMLLFSAEPVAGDLPFQPAPEAFDDVEVGAVGREEHEFEARVNREPGADGLRVVDFAVIDDDLHEAVRVRRGDREQEADEVSGATTLADQVDDLLGRVIHGAEDRPTAILPRGGNELLRAPREPAGLYARIEVEVGFVGKEDVDAWSAGDGLCALHVPLFFTYCGSGE